MTGLLVLSGIILYLAAAITLIQRADHRDRARFLRLSPAVSRASAPSVSPNAPPEARRRTPVDAAGRSCAASTGPQLVPSR